MPRVIDYSDYQVDDIDAHYLARRSTPDVSLRFFANYVTADLEHRKLFIDVDDVAVYNAIDVEERNIASLDDCEETKDYEPYKYQPFLREDGCFQLHKFAGEIVSIGIGEGLIDFCDTPIKQLTEFIFTFLTSIKDMPEFHTADAVPVESEKPKNEEELLLIQLDSYWHFLDTMSELMEANLYAYLFPPLVHGNELSGLKHYVRYLLELQKQYRELLQFCFDVGFYPDELGRHSAAARLRLYKIIHDLPVPNSLNQRFEFSKQTQQADFDISFVSSHLTDEYQKILPNINRSPNKIEMDFELIPGLTDILDMYESKLEMQYQCRSVEDILILEFEKMLELDMKIKHCKNCGRYFVLKGNYKTDFCDRIPEGDSRSCQSIGAIGNYQKKVAGNPALKLFNKYYKRYFARVNVGTIKEAAFKEWKYQAVVKRDECMLGESNGGISEQEFADWLEASFPNRVKKNKNRL